MRYAMPYERRVLNDAFEDVQECPGNRVVRFAVFADSGVSLVRCVLEVLQEIKGDALLGYFRRNADVLGPCQKCFFLEILNRTEYAEGYVMEPLAQSMLERDPVLSEAFQKKLLGDPDFAADSTQRLQWFYEKTPYYDSEYLVYPVARILGADD